MPAIRDLRILAALALVAACSGATPRPTPPPRPERPPAPTAVPSSVRISVTLAEGDSLAYRIERSTGDARVVGAVYLDGRRQGPSVYLEPEVRAELGLALADAVFLFPALQADVGRQPVTAVRETQVMGLGNAFRETLQVVGGDGETVRLRLTRENADPLSPVGAALDATGEAVYDVAHSRWVSLRWTDTAQGEEVTTSLTFDAEASRARRERRRQLATAAEEAGRGLDAWLAAHGSAAEIREGLEALAAGAGGAMAPLPVGLIFHYVGRNAAVWTAALAHPSAEVRDAFLLSGTVIYSGMQRMTMDDATIRLVRSRMRTERYLPNAFAYRIDARLRRELEWIASSKPDLAAAVRESLVALDRVREGPAAALRALATPAEEFPAGLRDVMRAIDDPAPWIPALIALAEDATADEGVRQECVAQVGALAAQSFGDAAAARRWLQEHEPLDYPAWLAEAARTGDREERRQAMLLMGRTPVTEPGRAALIAALAADDATLRFEAACSLARWRDPHAVPALIDSLETSEDGARPALFCLAELSDSHLGFDPEAAELARAEAVGRWRAWAARLPPP